MNPIIQKAIEQACLCQFNAPIDRTANDPVTPAQLRGKKKSQATLESWIPSVLAFIQKNPGVCQEQILEGLQKSRGRTLRTVLDKLIEDNKIIEKSRTSGSIRMKVYFPIED